LVSGCTHYTAISDSVTRLEITTATALMTRVGVHRAIVP
jgi:hypothetical protein